MFHAVLYRRAAVLLTAAALLTPFLAHAQGPPNQGPALVVTAPVEEGILAPQAEHHASVFFKEVSNVATEVSGKVVTVSFEEGEHVRAGQVLVQLDTILLQKELQAKEAEYQRYTAELNDARARFERAEALVADEVTTPQQMDQLRFEVESKVNQVAGIRAEAERIRTLIEKNTIRAPFDGVVLGRATELGEWKSTGDTVAVVALDFVYDVMVNVPGRDLRWIQAGETVTVNTAAGNVAGEVITVIPRGDVMTQSFPVKVRVRDVNLYEGMAALVQLPVGEKTACLFVSRDALLNELGRHVLFTTTEENVSRKHEVEVLGYDGLRAAVRSDELRPGQQVIVKGHERLRGGDPVRVVETAGSPAQAAPGSQADG